MDEEICDVITYYYDDVLPFVSSRFLPCIVWFPFMFLKLCQHLYLVNCIVVLSAIDGASYQFTCWTKLAFSNRQYIANLRSFCPGTSWLLYLQVCQSFTDAHLPEFRKPEVYETINPLAPHHLQSSELTIFNFSW